MPADVIAPAATETADLGATSTEQTVSTEAAAAPTETFDWSPYGEQHVAVKVNGEDLNVPLKEAIAGYQRQADYTRKTQDLAARQTDLEFAASLTAALERDPVSTLQFLGQAYGLDTTAQTAANQEPEILTPEEQKLQALDSTVSQLHAWQAQQQVRQELDGLKSQYGDINEAEVLRHAVEIGAPSLETAYAHMKFGEVMAELQATKSAQDARATEQAAANQQALDGKRGATAVVSSGHSPAAGVVTSGSGKPTLAEAALAAMQKHGFATQ